LDFVARDAVLPQHPREDLDAGLELLWDHFIGPQLQQTLVNMRLSVGNLLLNV
jgi:hypothetical protein